MRAIDVDSFAELPSDDALDVENEDMHIQAISNLEGQRLGRSYAAEFQRLADCIDFTLIEEHRTFNLAMNEKPEEYR